MLRLIFQKKQSFQDIQSTFSEKDFRFFESVILAWKDKTLQLWAIEAINAIFVEQLQAKETKRKSSYLNYVMGYFKNEGEGVQSSGLSQINSHFNTFSQLFSEEDNKLFHTNDISLSVRVDRVQFEILDQVNKVVLEVKRPSLVMQKNECFQNFNFTIQAIKGEEVGPNRTGSRRS